MTPDGLIRDNDSEPKPSVKPVVARRTDRLILTGVLILMALLLVDWFWPAERAAPTPAPVSAMADASIAVLPFVNMSPDPDNEFFADGISEELLNVLVGIEGLRVASRTSTFSFKSSAAPVPEIARLLDVRHVLEGSVRRQDQRVRITAQLIRAESDVQLWTQTFERDLTDIFRVQEEIAQAIATALEDVLGVRRVLVSPPTADLVAYERFLRGRSGFYRRLELDAAIDDLEFAVERDPGFAEAWAFLGAASYVASTGWPTERDRAVLSTKALLAAERALALEPELGIALAVKGASLFRDGDPAEMADGLRLLERAADQTTMDTSAGLWLGVSWLDLGFADRALPHLLKVQARDPLVSINNGYLALAHARLGQFEEGRRLALRAVELGGQAFWAVVIALEPANAGDLATASQLLAAAQPLVNDADREVLTGMRAALQYPSSQSAFLATHEAGVQQGRLLSMLAALMFRGRDLVFSREGPRVAYQFMTSSVWLPSLVWVREDPQFYRLMQQRGIVGFWEMHGFPPGCRAVDDPAGRRLDCSGQVP